MTHDAKLPDEQGKAREFWIKVCGFNESSLSDPVFQCKVYEQETKGCTHLIEYSAYDQLEARCKELEGEVERLHQHMDKLTEDYLDDLSFHKKESADQAALIGELVEALTKINLETKQHLKQYGIERNQNGTFICMIEAVSDAALARARHGDLRGE